MKALTPGANAAISGEKCAWTLECSHSSVFGEYAAVALLPVTEKRLPTGDPALFQVTQQWMEWSGTTSSIGCSLDLSRLPGGSERLLLVVYTFSAAGPISELKDLRLQVDNQVELLLDLKSNGESAIVIGEFYRRNDQWRFRALAEGSAYGLAAMGRRMGITIDDAHPARRPYSGDSPRNRGSATGTGFAVSPNHVMTCAHVIEEMQELHISSFAGRFCAEVVVVDRRNDMALLRIQDCPPLSPVVFKEGGGSCALGESVIVLGFPMAGLAGGGVHVTQGGVSGLFGLHNDASLLQFTAAIQPGSSGSPLFDTSGAVIGMVTSTLPDAQNMNFAVKSGLLMAFLDACHVSPPNSPTGRIFSTAEMAREAHSSLWRIEARNP
ncbi:trypsin-like peptidase domain-containing protein [Pseudomonas sp. H3(2019)]|uniref:trypsin-like peptidase domain-containing protein n=1 Tax=Pseudomonas sp. H3(2019) TaxID=2598724 RepID=UPI001195A39D|nr:trypsin-like peptidase domain-containing protein [Pseudomonas sp. H3(2019)]TVT85194.1 trypsin [Pseudomonas sp. H3(2019)]